MNDPLTYLDEVDARVADCSTYNFGMRNADDLAHVDAPALSKALRAVLAVIEEHERREAHNETVPLNRISDLRPEPSAADYRNAIQAALAVNDEGGK